MLKVFSIYDSKTEAFIQPFYSQATGAAIRSFETAANEEGHQFATHAGDYTLFELGTFDESAGRFSLLDAPINLGTALQMQRPGPTTAGGPSGLTAVG